MATTADIHAAEPKNRFETVTLVEPIVRGETRIEKLNIRKPKAGELRGLSLQDIMRNEATALLQLIPRVSEPPVTADEANDLESEDFAEISGVIRGFFMTSAEKQAIEALLAEHQPKS